jgi:hypothetical protein
MLYGRQAQTALKALSGLDIQLIATGHGIIWRSHIQDIMAKYQIDMYAAGLHRRGSKAVERYTNMEIREDFALRNIAFRQPAYKVDKDLNVLE